MNSRLRCAGCKEYFPAGEMYKSSRMQNFCSEECFWGRAKASRPAKKGPKTITRPKSVDVSESARAAIRQRDRSCRFCGATYGLHVHHIVYRSQGGHDDPSNLILLCNEHHSLVHSNKKKWKPVLHAYIWLHYMNGHCLPIPLLRKSLVKSGMMEGD